MVLRVSRLNCVRRFINVLYHWRLHTEKKHSMKTLIRRVTHAIAILLAATLLSACNEEKNNVIAFVNMDQLINEFSLQEQESTHLQQVRAALEQGAALAESRYEEMDQDKADAARASDTQVLNAQWQAEQASARSAVLKLVVERAEELREEKKLTAILPLQLALAASPEADFTSALAERLRDSKVTFGKLPDIALKEQVSPKVQK